jgi:hypothetical protein
MTSFISSRIYREHHETGFLYFSSLLALRQAGQTLDATQYSYCLRYILASLYVWKENARPQAIEELLLKDLDKAVEGVVFSQNFKTKWVYAWQPVTMNKLVELFIKLLRPESDSPYLFLTYTGTPIGQGYASKALNIYFSRFGLNMSVLVIRKLIEVRI